MDEMRPIGTLDNGGQGGVGSDGWVGGQNGTVEFVEPFLGRVEGDSRCLADRSCIRGEVSRNATSR